MLNQTIWQQMENLGKGFIPSESNPLGNILEIYLNLNFVSIVLGIDMRGGFHEFFVHPKYLPPETHYLSSISPISAFIYFSNGQSAPYS